MTHPLPFLPETAVDGMAAWKAAVIFLGTFVLEDVAAVGAGLWVQAGQIGWAAGWAACFLGIWLGDVGLYALARWADRARIGSRLLHRHQGRVARSQRWFEVHGTWILIFSRLIPGARLPTYLAAGFLRLPLLRFLIITGLASLLWAGAILVLVQTLGAQLGLWLGTYRDAGWILLGSAGLGWVAWRGLRRRGPELAWSRFATRLRRWGQWEFWPAWLFYPPVAIYCAWLALKHRSLTLPTAANPGIFTGGLVGESKVETLRDLMRTSPEFTAEAEQVEGATFEKRQQALHKACAKLGLQPPFILKPDVGQRGAGVKLIRSWDQAETYLQQTSAPLLVQRFVPGPREVGIFYYRFPGEPHGRIFSITEKIFPSIIGDGTSTLLELIHRDRRARFMAETYARRFRERGEEVLPAGVSLQLVESGNHAQGCIFRDGRRLRTPALEARIDEISRKLTGFHIGRYDIRYSDEAELCSGRSFRIVELNGAAAEATSIYDARTTLGSAYRTLFRQWALVFAIGDANRRRGNAPTRLALVWRAWRAYHRLAATYPVAD